ncbi:MAG: S9 family peptidase [Acidobacteria bacterium]|nr:MAG: S9 family peptidase [Acidobacteriota bacterium]REK03803.1 MAG: S9 family peptidase [Acidobacteriota bacterium]
MSIVDLIDTPSISSARLAPDGSAIVFVRSGSDWEQNRRVSHLWIAERDGGTTRQLTFSAGEHAGEDDPVWTPDGNAIVFLARRGEDEHSQVYLLPVAGGEARRLFEHPSSPASLAFDRGGRHLYFLASEPESEEEKKRKKAQDDVIDYDQDFKQRHLWRLAMPASPYAEIGEAAPERITEGDHSVTSFSLSLSAEHASTVIVHRAPTPLFDDSDESEVWRLDLAADEATGDLAAPTEHTWLRLTDNLVNESGGELSPDGTQVLFLAGADSGFEGYHNTNLFLVPASGPSTSAANRTHRLLLEHVPYGIDAARWTAAGRIVFLANTGVRSDLFEVDPRSEQFERLTSGDHSFRSWDYLPERGEHVMALSTTTSPGDLWLRDQGGDLRQVSSIFDDYAQRFALPEVEAITWTGADGEAVEGLLWYPLEYQAGTRYPLVVQTHGGPAASDKFAFGSWIDYPQLLAAHGWMVLQPNYRGSTGYGDEFLRDMVGSYFNQSHLDVMTGVDALIERGLVDGERMVKMGWSAGGHMTNKIITHTDRFKAASSGAGAINWVSMYGQSDVRIYRTPWFGGTPWEEDAPIQVYWEASPLKEIWKVKTPTLVLVGANDLRVPAAQSIELFRALRSHDVPTHLYMAPRAGHGWRELRHQLFKVNVEMEWFEKWARGREWTWEEAPGTDESEEETEEMAPAEEEQAPPSIG